MHFIVFVICISVWISQAKELHVMFLSLETYLLLERKNCFEIQNVKNWI